jgi:hypothetical protein
MEVFFFRGGGRALRHVRFHFGVCGRIIGFVVGLLPFKLDGA